MTVVNPCPVCGEGYLIPSEGTNIIKIHGKEYDVPFHFAVCNSCESEVADSEDSAKNKQIMLQIRLNVEHEMSEKSHERSNTE